MKLTLNPELFKKQQIKRIEKYFDKHPNEFVAFESKSDFLEWFVYEMRIMENKCHYCETSILDLRKLFLNNKIPKIDGMHFNFCLERADYTKNSSWLNGILRCFFCENEQKEVVDYDTKKDIIAPLRENYWRTLLNELDNQNL